MNAPPAKPFQDPNDSFLRILFSWPNVIIVVIIALIGLIALFYAEENWRGKHAWNKYRKELEAHGEQLDFKAFVPALVPDEENFAATPLVQSWFPRGNGIETDNYSDAEKLMPDWGTLDKGERHFIDLVAWEMALAAIESTNQPSTSLRLQSGKLDILSRAKAAPAVLDALTESKTDFEELRQASHRRYARYPIVYEMQKPWATLLPHLALLKRLCQRLQLKACAELAAGDGEKALEDVKLAIYLADTLKSNPFQISYLVRISMMQIAIHPVWEGLAEQRWSDSQLQEVQRLFSKYDFLPDAKEVLRSERACSVLIIDLVQKDRSLCQQNELIIADSSSPFKSAAEGVFSIIPDGWFYQEQINYCKLFQLQSKSLFEATNRTISPAQSKTGNERLEKILQEENLFTNHRLMSGFLLPSLGRIGLKTARVQVAADQAVIACALERNRLAGQKFPEKLQDLVPKFVSALPTDILTGMPYKYQRSGASFILYCNGWDEKDDGGVSGKELFDESGDWVWKYPQK